MNVLGVLTRTTPSGLICCSIFLIEHKEVAEETREEVAGRPVEEAVLEFVKPVTPELRTLSEQELQLE